MKLLGKLCNCIAKGAGRISTTRAKMGLRPEFLSEHHQNWRAKRFWVLITGVWRVFILATFNFTLYFFYHFVKNGHKLPEILKIGSKIKVHQNENPSNPSCKHSKAHYWPILVMFRQKLWPQSHFGPGRRYPISPFHYIYFQFLLPLVEKGNRNFSPFKALESVI